MSWGSIARLFILGIIFHLVYIGTVFDCYFTSPVVHGMRQYKLPQAQAKRLVLIIGAQTQPPPLWKETTLAFGRNADVAPHIYQVMACAPTLPLLQMLHRSCRARRSVSHHI
jgi:GPI ethanolamine phosphate transferase 1